MLKNLSNLFGKGSSDQKVAPQPIWEAESSDPGSDSVSLEVIETIRDLKCFLADGTMQVALFGSPSDLPDGWMRNCPWDQVFRSYPNLLPLDQRLTLQEAQKLAPLVDSLIDDADASDESLVAEDLEENDSGTESSDGVSTPQEAQKLAPLVDSLIDDADASDESLVAEDLEENDSGTESSDGESTPATAFRDWLKEVSEANSLDAKAVRRVAKALASEIQLRIEAGDSFKIGDLRFRSRTYSDNSKFSGFFSRVSRS